MTQAYFEPPLTTAVVEGAQRAWREAGAGARLPLVLLHGIGSNARAWAGQFAHFSPERRVVAWNAPGYAGSDPLPSQSPSPEDYGDALLALLDHLEIPRCVLVGQSLGAIVATAAALRAPKRVAALALASPASGYAVASGDALPDKVAKRIVDVTALGPERLADQRAGALLTAAASQTARGIVHKAMSEVTVDGYGQAVRMLAAADLPVAVRDLSMPVLVMWGAADTVTPPEGCRRVALSAPCAHWIELPALGHGMATEGPESFNAALVPLIDAADAAEE